MSSLAATGVLPNADIIFVGTGATAFTGTLPTNSMRIGQTTFVKRNVGATGAITLKGQSGKIQALNNTLGTTTTLAAAGSLGSNVQFIWNGTDLIRLLNG